MLFWLRPAYMHVCVRSTDVKTYNRACVHRPTPTRTWTYVVDLHTYTYTPTQPMYTKV